MRLLFDRQTLREFLRGLGTGFSRYRVLAVDGPAGTGKSYTAVVLDAIARATNQLEVVVIRPQDARTTVDDVTREIHERLLWRWEEPVETTTTRRMRMYADMIRTKARRRSQTLILMFDIETPMRPDVRELIRELARNVGSLALVIAGRDKQWLPPEALPHVMFEHLADLTHEDIADGLRHIATDLNLTAQHVEPLISAMLERLVPGPNFNARVNQLTRKIVESWLESSA